MTGEQKEARRQLWKKRVAAFKESGKSARSWCKENDLKEHQLRYWLEKYDDLQNNTKQSQKQDTKWISVDVKEKTVYKDSVIIVRIDEAIIEVKPGFDPTLLRDVIQALNVKC